MKILLMGGRPLGVMCLQYLLNSKHNVHLWSNDDEPRINTWYNSPLQMAQQHDVPIFQGDPNKYIKQIRFIDENHDEKFCRQDYNLWSPLVMHGGYILFHDSSSDIVFPGLFKVAQEKIVQSGKFVDIRYTSSITSGQKV